MPSSVAVRSGRAAIAVSSRSHRAGDVGDARLERRIDALDRDEAPCREARRSAPSRACAGATPVTCGIVRSFVDFGFVVVDATGLRDVDMRLAPRIRSRSSCWSPVITASAMMTAITPTVTPIVDIERDDRDERLLPLGEQVAKAMCSSKGRSIFYGGGAHPRRELRRCLATLPLGMAAGASDSPVKPDTTGGLR